MKLLLGCAIFFVSMTLGIGFGYAQDPLIFIKTYQTAVASADRDGALLWNWQLPFKLPIGQDGLAPILTYATNQSTPSGAMFGQNWFCPLLECCVVSENERSIRFYTPGGGQILLYGNANGGYSSGDSRLSAKEQGRKVELLTLHKELFEFEAGKLKRLNIPNVDEFTWIYQNDKLQKIVSTRKTLLEVQWENGTVKALIADGKKFICGYESAPVFNSGQASNGIRQLVPTLAKISEGDRSWLDLKYTFDVVNGEGAFKAVEPKREIEFTWDLSTGSLLSDAVYSYKSILKDSLSLRPTIIAKHKLSDLELSYAYDPRTGISERHLPNGRVERRTYILTKGGAFGKIRSIKVNDENDNIIQSATMEYSKAGRLIRQIQNLSGEEKIKTFDPETGILKRITVNGIEKQVAPTSLILNSIRSELNYEK